MPVITISGNLEVFWANISSNATRQPMVALRVDSAIMEQGILSYG